MIVPMRRLVPRYAHSPRLPALFTLILLDSGIYLDLVDSRERPYAMCL